MTPGIAFATYLLLAVALFGLFLRSSRRLDPETRQSIRRWILREDRSKNGEAQWAQGFLSWFDQAFRVRTRRLPFLGKVALPSFRRSVLVSFLSLLVLAIVWLFNKPGFSRAMEHDHMTAGTWEMVGRLLLVYGGGTLITNWIPDYLSLIESRYIIGKMAKARTWPRRLGWLAIDAVATASISFLAIHAGMLLLLPVVTPGMDIEVGCLTPDGYTLETAWTLFVSGLRFEGPPGTLNYDATGIYIYSTFITSLWVWIYLGGSFLLRAVFALRGSSSARLRRRPLQSMGIMVVLIFSMVFWPSWLHRRAKTADVYIHHVESDADVARALAAQLEGGGLRARTSADTSPELAAQLLQGADGVVLIDSVEARATGEVDRIRHELYLQGECGERAWGSTARVTVGSLPARSGYAEDPLDIGRYGSWMHFEPGSSASDIIRWGQDADSLLSPSQVRACQELFGTGDDRFESCDARLP
jgi:hypothetical protein